MRFYLPLLLAFLLIAGGIYYQFYYPPNAFRHKTQAALDEFSAAVATKDRVKIGEALGRLLSEQAHIKLEIGFFSLSQPDSKTTAQEFDKQGFIAFVDTIL